MQMQTVDEREINWWPC